jgi:arsenate reductase
LVDRDLARRLVAEALGTGMLVVAVVGSGIAAERLSPGDVGLQLFENAAATAAALIAIILALGPVSGAHLNPVVTLVDRALGRLSTIEAATYVGAQLLGAAVGVVIANLMFSLPAIELSTKARSSGGLWLAEMVATFGLVLVIFGLVRSGRTAVAPFAVGAYIGGAYFFTASTSFANPAVTAARMLSDTFTGIAPGSVLPFLAAQTAGAALAVPIVRFLYPTPHAAVPTSTAAPREGVAMADVPEVLFVCVHNAGRSQMAAALLDHHAQGRVRVRSAGSAPAGEVNPAVVEAMAEVGIDISKEFPKPLTDDAARAADVLVTMGCGDACPVYPGKRYLDWELADPAGEGLAAVRPIRDEIDRRVRTLLGELVPTGAQGA